MSTVNQPKQPMALKISLRHKLLIGFTLVFTAVFAVSYYWFYTYSTDVAISQIKEDLIDTLQGTIASIDGDEFEQLVKEGQPDDSGVPSQDPRYQRHQNWLIKVHGVEPDAFNTYSYVKGDSPDEVLWVGDNYREIQPEVATTFLESYTRTPDSLILQGFVKETVNMEFYEDPWGEHVSAYGPIQNTEGKVVGAVGIDFKANYVREVQKRIQRNMIFSFAIAYIALFILVYLISVVLAAPIVKLTYAAERVGEGHYEQDFSNLMKSRFPDEIDSLANSFSNMTQKVYQREQNLRRQVEKLKIEIDESKRSRQVDEIVDTDFFRDLQGKAKQMRARREHKSGADKKNKID